MNTSNLQLTEYISDDAVVNQGTEYPKPCLSPVEVCESTSASNSTPAQLLPTKHKGPTFPHNLLLVVYERREKNINTMR